MPAQVQDTKVETHAETASAREVLLLPGHVFFARSVPLPPGMKPDELESFVEITLEQIAPFPVNQLFYGHYLPEGAQSLFLYAAYRKKLAAHTGPVWDGAHLVVPAFAAAFARKPDGDGVVLLTGDTEMTGILWKKGSDAPDKIVSRPLHPDEANPGEARRRLLEKLGAADGGIAVRELGQPSGGRLGKKGAHFYFPAGAAGGQPEEVELAGVDPLDLDVRDKAFLFFRRKNERQNRWMWNLLLLLLFGLLAMGVMEIGLHFGGRQLEARQERIDALVDRVARIEQELELATRLEELSGTRLLPFEMLSHINQIRPRSIHFTRAAAVRGNTIELDAQTRNPQDAERFEAALRRSEAITEVSPNPITPRTVDGRTTFQVQLRFEEGTLSPSSLRRAPPPPPEEEVLDDEVPPEPVQNEDGEAVP